MIVQYVEFLVSCESNIDLVYLHNAARMCSIIRIGSVRYGRNIA